MVSFFGLSLPSFFLFHSRIRDLLLVGSKITLVPKKCMYFLVCMPHCVYVKNHKQHACCNRFL